MFYPNEITIVLFKTVKTFMKSYFLAIWIGMIAFFSAEEGRFIFKEFFNVEFYKQLFDNVITDSVAQLLLWFTPIAVWITLLISGRDSQHF